MEGSAASESFSLRPATEDDLPQVLAIEAAVKAANWTEENFRAELSKPYSHFLVLTDDETDSKIAAYIVFWIMFDECQILDLAVDHPFRGLGNAKKLVHQAIHEATRKGIRKVLLDVRKSNQPAVQLYQSLKFVITHVRKTFYSDGEDAFQMALYLNEIQVEF